MLDMGLLAHEQVDEGRAKPRSPARACSTRWSKGGSLIPSMVTMAKATYFGVESVNLGELRLADDDAINAVPRHVAKKFNAIPVGQSDGTVIVALSDPSDIDALDGLRHALNKDIELRVTSSEDIEAALGQVLRAAPGATMAASPR